MLDLDQALQQYKHQGDTFFVVSPVECPFCGNSDLPQPQIEDYGSTTELCAQCLARYTLDPLCEPGPTDPHVEVKYVHNYLYPAHGIDRRLPELFEVTYQNYQADHEIDVMCLVFWQQKQGRPREYSPYRQSEAKERMRVYREKRRELLKNYHALRKLLKQYEPELPPEVQAFLQQTE